MPWLLMLLGHDVFGVRNMTFGELLTAIYFREGLYPNGPVWFLVCLFQVNAMFCVMQLVTKSMKWIVLLSCIAGTVGMLMSYYGWNLYMNTDSALTGLPFFCLGYYLKHETDFISEKRIPFWSLLGFVLFVSWFVYRFSRNAEFNFNLFANKLTVYPCGILGSIAVLAVSKNIGRVPILSYWGRYSIIILCTHYFMLDVLKYMISGTCMDRWWVCFSLIMISYFAIIPLFVRYLPYVTAQKDVFSR